MNVTATSDAGSNRSEPAATGGLVVLNGRLKGARRPLTGPMTLIGQAQGCEVRLNVQGVKPYHCAIIQSVEGYLLRDLAGEETTFLNGKAVLQQVLRSGDRIEVGPFQFQIDCPDSLQAENVRKVSQALRAERDALRIQAAAMAAQYAGLTEEEIRLEQRRLALQRQEEQLAGRLEERHRELREQEENLRREQDAFTAEREAEQLRQRRASEELANLRQELETNNQALLVQQKRHLEMRRRLKKRWHRHWEIRQIDMGRREQTLAAGQADLEAGLEKLAKEKTRLQDARLAFNGEMELGRRQVQEQWQELALAQQSWELTLNEEHGDRSRRLKVLEEREAACQDAEATLLKEQQAWAAQRSILEMELERLETRLVQYQPEEADLAAQSPATHGSERDWPTKLKQLAGTVADQRWHLAEQWERLLQFQESWTKERETLLAELEEEAHQLCVREQRVVERNDQLRHQEDLLQARVVQLQEQNQELSRLRGSLESWQARVLLQAASWEGEREEVITSVRAREEAMAGQLHRASELHRVRTERVRHQAVELRKARSRCEEVRKQYIALWKACKVLHRSLTDEHQAAAKQNLVLDCYRGEYIETAEDPVVAEKRLTRLEQSYATKCRAIANDAERHIARERQAVVDEMTRLEERARAMNELEQDLVRRADSLARQLSELEDQRVHLAQTETHRQQELASERMHHRRYERQVAELRDEVERLARALFDEVEVRPVESSSQREAA